MIFPGSKLQTNCRGHIETIPIKLYKQFVCGGPRAVSAGRGGREGLGLTSELPRDVMGLCHTRV